MSSNAGCLSFYRQQTGPLAHVVPALMALQSVSGSQAWPSLA